MNVNEINNPDPSAFYKEALQLLTDSKVPFLLGGAFATFHYTGLTRNTKDLDIFVKTVDFPQVLKLFADKGYTTKLHDVRWIAKIFRGSFFIDLIFSSVNNICSVDDSWFEYAHDGEFDGIKVKVIPPEEHIWCKSYIWNRERFDGADINHILLKCGRQLDWKRLYKRLEQHWHLLLAEIIMFQFVYPSEYRDIIPRWLFNDLIERAQGQYDLPPSMEKVCRGPMVDSTQYSTDVKEWNYKSYTIMTV